ncbi:MAG: hypothetical protein AB7S38_39320 [Vulcanimicrobiota bacterium]
MKISNPFKSHARPGSFSEAVKSQQMKVAGNLAVAGADAYVGALGILKPEAGYAPVMAGWMAAGHAAYGIYRAWPFGTDRSGDPILVDKAPKDLAVGVGHLITAAGLAGMAAGAGPVAVPVIALGQLTALGGEYLTKD